MTSLMSQLSWTHYTVVITITDNEKRRFYEEHTIQNAWSVRELRRQIRSNLYLNWYKEHKWQEGQRQPIGLIICKTKDEETVHYALGDLKREIFVAEYEVKLPSEEEIKRRIEWLEE